MQSVFHYATTLKGEYCAAISLPTMRKPQKVNTALQSVFLGTKPKRTVVCNQSFNYAKTLKGEYSAAINLPLVPDVNGRWFASNRGRSWTTAETVLQEMPPSAESLTGRPPDTLLQSMQPSAGSITG